MRKNNYTDKIIVDLPFYKKINLIFVVFLIILAAIIYYIYISPRPQPPSFIITTSPKSKNNNIIFNTEIISQPDALKAAHSSSVVTLPNGDILAFWFAGSHEGNPDVKIWQSKFNGESWSLARPIVSPHLIAETTNRYTKKVGNPVAYLAANGKLHLFVVSVGIGGWSGSSLNHFISNDYGVTWTDGDKLILSPFLNISTLVRTNAVPLSDGGFYLPVYHELVRTYPELLRFNSSGNFIGETRLTNQNTLLQPALLPISSESAFAYMRNNQRIDQILYYQQTNNGGLNWSRPLPTNLTNPDSSLVVARIESNQFLMIHNIANRNKLALSYSTDGIKWNDFYLLENTQGEEFSYPSITMHDNLIDILYTWKRLKIKHVRFNQTWLEMHIKNGDKIDK
jgi:predicted neuraminidase